MEEIHRKSEPNKELDQDYLLFIDIKKDVTWEHEVLDVKVIKPELDTDYLDQYIKPEINNGDYIVEELTPGINIKTEISNEKNSIFAQNTEGLMYKKKCKQSFGKQKWLKRLFKRLNQRLFKYRNTSTSGGFRSNAARVRRFSSPQNECVFCYFCVKPFFSVPHYWTHFIRCHLLIKILTLKNRLGYDSFKNTKKRNSLRSNTNSKARKYLTKQDHSGLKKPSNSQVNFPVENKSLESQKCVLCLKTFKKRSYMKIHMNVHAKIKPFKCEICSRAFTIKSNLNIHMKIHAGIKSFKCEICLKEFTHKSALNTHVNIHAKTKPFKCEICMREFTHKSAANRHMNVHTGLKPFKCTVCSKEFIQQCYLNKHINIHMGSKPFKCEMCPKAFRDKSHLNRHMYIHTGIPFKCGICLKEFTHKIGLEGHMYSHTGVKPFKCGVCLRDFTRKSSLDAHMNLHTGLKPFQCKICSKGFTYKYSLNLHINLHTGVRPYNCTVCLEEFRYRSTLNRHMEIHKSDQLFSKS